MPREDGEAMEINLGEVTGSELMVAGYEALKMTFAAAIAQLSTKDMDPIEARIKAKGLFAAISNDVDVERAKFIIAMREDAERALQIVDGEVEDGPSDSS